MVDPNVRREWDDSGVAADSSLDWWRIASYPDFDDLLAGSTGIAMDSTELLDLAFKRGRVLLQAPAGSGKSSFVRSLARNVSLHGRQARVIALSYLDVSDELWQSQEGIEEWLLAEFGRSPHPKLLLCLDGLDSLPVKESQRLLSAIEEVTRNAPASAVLVSDRLNRRVIRAQRWVLASITPRANAVNALVRSHLLAAGEPHPNSSPIPVQDLGDGLERRLTETLPGSKDLDALANATLDHLQREGLSPFFERRWLEDVISKHNVQRLETEEILSAHGPTHLHFMHMLYPAFLAARALSMDERDWNSGWFSVVTARGSNLEVLGFLLQLIEADKVDVLVRAVDEWNFYAAMYVLSEDLRAGDRTSPSLRSALLLLMGRRRFSGVPSTRIQAEDSLRLHGGSIAKRLLSVDSLDSVISIALDQSFSDEWWLAWQRLFVREAGSAAFASDIQALASDDAVIGWTAANVLLTLRIDARNRAEIAALARTGPNESVRWRAVHVLGSLGTEEAWSTCFEVFKNDRSTWVRNGALRSLILAASRLGDSEDRSEVFSTLGSLSAEILDNPKWSREVERSVQIENRPAGWSDSVAVLLEALWARANSVEDQDRWRTLSASLRTPWRGVPELGSEA
ncbi:MAG: ATP-binding protein [Mycobacterium sp.]